MWRNRVAPIALVLLALVLAPVGLRADTAQPAARVTVLTRNVYLGADITAPVRAATGRSGAAALLALGHANLTLRDDVDRTDFAVRARLLAAEIVATRPDLVGLQEVALWRHGPLDLTRVGALDATTVDLDFLALLRAELTRRGARYDVGHVQTESDVEGPAFRGDPRAGGPDAGGPVRGSDVRFTDRDVVLVRAGAGLSVTGSGGGAYGRRLEVPLAGSRYAFTRGFGWVDVAAGATRFRFVTTHLESQSSALALVQLGELLSGPALPRTSTVVLVGDFNSDPDDDTVRAGDRVPRSAAYDLVTGRGRFTDAWTALPTTPGPGHTGTLGTAVDDPTAAALRRRLDLVLVRPGPLGSGRADTARLVGDRPSDRDPATGLWPSDHAGVVVTLSLG